MVWEARSSRSAAVCPATWACGPKRGHLGLPFRLVLDRQATISVCPAYLLGRDIRVSQPSLTVKTFFSGENASGPVFIVPDLF